MGLAVDLDSRLEVSASLQAIINALGVLSANPADASAQSSVRSAFDQLGNRMIDVADELTEADAQRLAELGAAELFRPDLYESLADHFGANVGTPAVSQSHVQTVYERRQEILRGFQTVIGVAQDREWDVDAASGIEGDAEIGFTVPRAIFANNLRGLTKELEWINRFLSTVAEAATGEHDDFEVSRLSTSDPTVFVVTGCGLALTVGRLIKWGVETWKTVEEIRKLRAETAKLKAFSPEEVDAIFGEKIRVQVVKEIEDQAARLTQDVRNEGRRNELTTGLGKLLDQFLQRIERGMTVEIRLLQHSEPGELPAEETEEQRDLQVIAAELKFPNASDAPVLRLTGGAAELNGNAQRPVKAKRKKQGPKGPQTTSAT
ncbi:hypothetical protein N0B51_05455 [Tsuneonella sp. YG55]|uniref:Uncharacterized protein n=1 Tax=Tsuneonella litorea TaxID=2976475 RepID=A0A9X3AMH1_9SPHN|nr:hypothetical protein [Tsuneonella litorea]MCT2558422.1 hypothetical protein [Tsuneonella litorea]